MLIATHVRQPNSFSSSCFAGAIASSGFVIRLMSFVICHLSFVICLLP
ncbi:hypothetical protein [Coleofasciculus sp. F4-SAH-05]